MAHAGCNDDYAVGNLEYEAVLPVNADAPPSRAVVLERFSLADAAVAVAVDALDELAYLAVCLLVAL